MFLTAGGGKQLQIREHQRSVLSCTERPPHHQSGTVYPSLRPEGTLDGPRAKEGSWQKEEEGQYWSVVSGRSSVVSPNDK